MKLQHSEKYANVHLRFIAWKIDALIMSLPAFLGLYWLVSQPSITQGVGAFFSYVAYIFIPMIFVQFFYHFYCISHWGKTLGKAVVGIEVGDEKGKLLSNEHAFMRENVTKGISAVLFGAGFWAAAFNKDHRAWHDEFAGSYVYKKEVRWFLGVLAILGLLALYVFASIWLFQIALNSPMIQEIRSYLPI